MAISWTNINIVDLPSMKCGIFVDGSMKTTYIVHEMWHFRGWEYENYIHRP